MLLHARTAAALVFYFNGAGTRSVTLIVGSNNATINNVTFDVLTTNIAPTPAPVTGVAGGGAPPATPAGGVQIALTTNRRGAAPDFVTLTANASVALACQSGACLGSGASIPFSTISWTSYEPTGGAFAAGIPSGTFTGAANQPLVTVSIPPAAGSNSFVLQNTLLFRYSNVTLYPSGVYTGRVVYTATAP